MPDAGMFGRPQRQAPEGSGRLPKRLESDGASAHSRRGPSISEVCGGHQTISGRQRQRRQPAECRQRGRCAGYSRVRSHGCVSGKCSEGGGHRLSDSRQVRHGCVSGRDHCQQSRHLGEHGSHAADCAALRADRLQSHAADCPLAASGDSRAGAGGGEGLDGERGRDGQG